MTTKKRKRPRQKFELEVAPDVQASLEDIVRTLPERFGHVDVNRVVCFRSRGSTARIYARIWELPRIFQMALGVQPHYAIEVVGAYDRLDGPGQEKTVIHELLHIPKTFSGAILPHRCFGRAIDCEAEETVYAELVAARGAQAPETSPEPSAVAELDTTAQTRLFSTELGY